MLQNSIFKNSILLGIPVLLFSACATNKYAATNKVYKEQAKAFGNTIQAIPPVNQLADSVAVAQQSFIGSVNFGIRKPNYVIIHHTALKSTDLAISTFINKKNETSAHYVIGRDGKLVQMVNDYLRANHAGVGKWGNTNDLNSGSIGIELDNNGNEPFQEAQIKTLMALLATLKKKYNIPAANFIGHSDIAPGRKIDPYKFPWKQLSDKGFGLWYDAVLQIPPDSFDTVAALRIIGYNTSNITAAVKAFKIHFIQKDESPVLSQGDKMILFNLYKKYL